MVSHRSQEGTGGQPPVTGGHRWSDTGHRRAQVVSHRSQEGTGGQPPVTGEHRWPDTGHRRAQVANHRSQEGTASQTPLMEGCSPVRKVTGSLVQIRPLGHRPGTGRGTGRSVPPVREGVWDTYTGQGGVYGTRTPVREGCMGHVQPAREGYMGSVPTTREGCMRHVHRSGRGI